MRSTLTRRIGTILLSLGFDPRRLVASVRFLPRYVANLVTYAASRHGNAAAAESFAFVPVLSDCYMPSGVARGHYFHQDLWAARKIFSSKPAHHIDVGSRIDGFVAHLLTFRTVTVLDIRSVACQVAGLEFRRADIMDERTLVGLAAESVSCLHSLEHFGLGRYGDNIARDGWITGLSNLAQMTKVGGNLYISVPIGRPAIEYNAQRIFDPQSLPRVAEQFGLSLVEFAYVDDDGLFHEGGMMTQASCEFGCGCYVFKRVEPS